jgi:uncharacterized membrane protein HdeD (DUF308 family)
MKYWFLWLIVGILSIVAGILALANPFAATLTAELFAGYSFIAIGILMLISAFQSQGWGARIWAILLGILFIVGGYNLVAQPLAGILTLTAATAGLLIAIGIFRLVLAFSPAAEGARWIVAIAGVISLVLGGMIFANFPESSVFILGVFLAVELLSNGVSLIMLALDGRKSKKAEGEAEAA